MGFLDRFFGNDAPRPHGSDVFPERGSDEQAIRRYRYMVRTAPPEVLEQAHADAFEQLTPEQRRQVLSGLAQAAPPGESASLAATSVDDPQAMARAATRAEIRQPGTMERTIGSAGGGFGGPLLSSFAMGFVGSIVANSFFSAVGGFDGDQSGPGRTEEASHDEEHTDYGEYADDGGFDGGDYEV